MKKANFVSVFMILFGAATMVIADGNSSLPINSDFLESNPNNNASVSVSDNAQSVSGNNAALNSSDSTTPAASQSESASLSASGNNAPSNFSGSTTPAASQSESASLSASGNNAASNFSDSTTSAASQNEGASLSTCTKIALHFANDSMPSPINETQPWHQLGWLLQNLGEVEPENVSQQVFQWNDYSLVVRDGNSLETEGTPPPQFSFDKLRGVPSFSEVQQVLGQPTGESVEELKKYVWSCPDSNAEMVFFSNDSGEIVDYNGHVCTSKCQYFYNADPSKMNH